MPKKQKPAKKKYSPKEIYLSRYWLIINTDPRLKEFYFDETTDSNFPVVEEWKKKWKDVVLNVGFSSEGGVGGVVDEEKWKKNFGSTNITINGVKYPLLHRWRDMFDMCLGVPIDMVDNLLREAVEEGIRLPHTKDCKSITCIADISRLWKDAGVDKLDSRDPDFGKKWRNRLEAYLAEEHKKNLKILDEEEGFVASTIKKIKSHWKLISGIGAFIILIIDFITDIIGVMEFIFSLLKQTPD